MKIDVLTLFPEMFDGVFNSSILEKRKRRGSYPLKQSTSVLIQAISITRLMIIHTAAVAAWS